MGVMKISVKASDFDWVERLKDAASEKEDLFPVIFAIFEEGDQANDLPKLEIARLLLYICDLRLTAANFRVPLKHPWDPIELSDADLDFLKSVAPQLAPAYLRARAHDLSWIYRRDIASARLAIEFYLVNAESKVGNAFDRLEEMERATRLSRIINDGDLLAIVRDAVRRILFSDPDPLTFFHARAAEVLALHDIDDPINVANRCQQLATDAGANANLILKKRMLELSADWFRRSGDEPSAKSMLVERAEVFVKEAEALTAIPNISFGKPTHLIECAIEAYRKIGGHNTRIEILLKQLAGYSKEIPKQMVPLDHDLDLNEMAAAARQLVTRESAWDAIEVLARMTKPQSFSGLKHSVSELNKQFLSRRLFGQVKLGRGGQVIARAGAITGDNETSAAFLAQMFQDAALHRTIVTLGGIEPARLQILSDHTVRWQHLSPLIFDNPIVPVGREQLFFEGLLAGFDGNFAVASHLLIPQIEHLIRILLARAGRRTHTHTSDGIQNEQSLNITLLDPELEKILGEDLVFDLKGLFIEPFGSNLRNEMAHGLRPATAFLAYDTVYCWWLTLYLLFLPLPAIAGKPASSDV